MGGRERGGLQVVEGGVGLGGVVRLAKAAQVIGDSAVGGAEALKNGSERVEETVVRHKIVQEDSGGEWRRRRGLAAEE